MTGITIDIINPGEWDWTSTRKVIGKLPELGLNLPSGNINIKIVDETEITALNTQYTGNAYATDVLSISYIEGDQAPIGEDIGDIAICQPIAAAQAKEAGTTLAEELALLSLHGVLHVIGYDHQTQRDKSELNLLQQQLMTRANLTYRDFSWE